MITLRMHEKDKGRAILLLPDFPMTEAELFCLFRKAARIDRDDRIGWNDQVQTGEKVSVFLVRGGLRIGPGHLLS